MPKRSIGERLEQATRRKRRAEQQAAKLVVMQRKARTRQLIEVGGLAAKAGIVALPLPALYEWFLRIAEEAKDPKAVDAMTRSGGRHFKQEADTRVVAIAQFSNKIAPDLSAQLRALGFRWNRFLLQWEGKVDFALAKKTIEEAGGTIREVRADELPSSGPKRPGKSAGAHPASGKPGHKPG